MGIFSDVPPVLRAHAIACGTAKGAANDEGLRDDTIETALTNGGYKMPEATINHSLRWAGRSIFSVTVGAAAFAGGFLLAVFVFATFVVALLPSDAFSPALLVMLIPWVLWLGLFARSAAAKDSWLGAAKRIGFLVTATAAAIAAGVFLAASIVAVLIVVYDGGSLLWLVIPLLLLAVTAASAVWLARHSRISRPWLACFLIGAGALGPAYVALFALTFEGS